MDSRSTFSSSSKDSPGADFKTSGEDEKKYAEDPGNEDSEVPTTEEPRVNQEKDANVNNTNNINTVSPDNNAAGIKDNVVDENIVYGCADDPNILDLEEIGRFGDVEDDDSGDDMKNLDTYFQVSHVPTTRIHKDHSLNQVIRDLQSTTQTRQMTKKLEEYGFIQRISLLGFPAQSVGSPNTEALDSPCLLVLITETSQSRQHVLTSLIHIESYTSPTKSLFDDGSSRISIFTVNTFVSLRCSGKISRKMRRTLYYSL
uniref:Uncharacterized protein n=1 Tax=Tanacetum cinerariifolium TaxID=118510 RepID=A0A6L2L5M1_TANCI|nr:hypothetical protein [Tanacetum cinerariifolium]